MPISQNLEKKESCLIRENKCFSYKQNNHTVYNYFSKKKIAAILKNISKNSKS